MNPNGRHFEEHWVLLKQILIQHIEENCVVYTPHARKRMAERHIEQDVVEGILKDGNPVEMFNIGQYPYGDKPFTNTSPVFTVVGNFHGAKIAVGLTIQQKIRKDKGHVKFFIKTVFRVEHSRFN